MESAAVDRRHGRSSGAGGLAKTYGAHLAEKGVIYRQYGGPVFDMYLLTMTRQQMLDSLILPATAPSVAVAAE